MENLVDTIKLQQVSDQKLKGRNIGNTFLVI